MRCWSTHVCPFLPEQVRAYLKKKYPFQQDKVKEAESLMGSIDDLRFRPLILSHIEDLVELNLEGANRYEIFETIIEIWLRRELNKKANRGKMTKEELINVSISLALQMHLQGKRMLKLDHETMGFASAVDALKFEGNSLLNRNTYGEYQFAHKMIQEFLVAYAIVKSRLGGVKLPIAINSEVLKFLMHKPGQFAWKAICVDEVNWNSLDSAGWETEIRELELDLIWIPPGKFRMGSPDSEKGREDNEQLHEVTLTQGFWIGKFPVTQKQWKQVMGSNPSYFQQAGIDAPVENVSWDDTIRFCQRINQGIFEGVYSFSSEFHARLPTEAQWEYACRAGTEKVRLMMVVHAPSRWEKTRPFNDWVGLTTIAESIRIRLGKRKPMLGGFMICTAMSGNGVKIGMVNMLRKRSRIRWGLIVAGAGCCVAAAFGPMRGTAALPIASTTSQRIGATLSASAWP